MTPRSLLIVTAVVLSAALINPADSLAQRQRWPGGNGGGQQNGGNGGGRQRDSGGGGGERQRAGGGERQRDSGGSPQRDSGSRPQASGRTQERPAPQSDPGGDRAARVRREPPPEARESAPPPQVRAVPPQESRPAPASQDDRRAAVRRVPNDADRPNVDRGNVTRGNVDRGTRIREGENRAGARDRGDRGGTPRANGNLRNGSRVAVPRTGPPPERRGDRDGRNFYGSRHSGRTVYGRYAYGGSRNIYIVPRGRTYGYYPRYYYSPFAFGFGPAGRGHFYFDLHYNSYIWHPYSVYRYGSYGSYGYPVGELRLKVHPRDAQVFIDGYYAGRVDDFDGVFQSLRLEEGEYQVEIVLPGYEPLAFDVRIFPGEKTTYEGDLLPE